MLGLLITQRFAREYGERVEAVARAGGLALEPIALADAPDASLAPRDLARIELAFMSSDVVSSQARAFMIAALKARRLRWLHLSHTGVDHPVCGHVGAGQTTGHALFDRLHTGTNAAKAAVHRVASDPEDPDEQARVALEAFEHVEDREEDLLRDVLGLAGVA